MATVLCMCSVHCQCTPRCTLHLHVTLSVHFPVHCARAIYSLSALTWAQCPYNVHYQCTHRHTFHVPFTLSVNEQVHSALYSVPCQCTNCLPVHCEWALLIVVVHCPSAVRNVDSLTSAPGTHYTLNMRLAWHRDGALYTVNALTEILSTCIVNSNFTHTGKCSVQCR